MPSVQFGRRQVKASGFSTFLRKGELKKNVETMISVNIVLCPLKECMLILILTLKRLLVLKDIRKACTKRSV